MKPPPLSLEEAQARLLALAPIMPSEHADIESAAGRYLAAPLIANRTQPPASLSAMDGYAVAPTDLVGPWRIVGESAAGHPYSGVVRPGQAVRIATGAMLPSGTAAVIVQEDVSRDGDSLTLTGSGPEPAGKHIRAPGMDFASGQTLLNAGAKLGPAQLALAIAAGHHLLPVRRRPRLMVIDSGDELALPGSDCAAHQVPASNGAMLAALAASVPCQIERRGPVPDRADLLATALADASHADVIVTSGGASVGDHDLIRPVLEQWGARIDFWRIAIKPGKPLLVAQRGKQVILGLPGNPVSAYITAYFFLLPLLRATLGARQPLPLCVGAKLAAPLARGGPRREFLRAVWDGRQVFPQTLQDSAALRPLATANALIDWPAGSPGLEPGAPVELYPLENGGTA